MNSTQLQKSYSIFYKISKCCLLRVSLTTLRAPFILYMHDVFSAAFYFQVGPCYTHISHNNYNIVMPGIKMYYFPSRFFEIQRKGSVLAVTKNMKLIMDTLIGMMSLPSHHLLSTRSIDVFVFLPSHD